MVDLTLALKSHAKDAQGQRSGFYRPDDGCQLDRIEICMNPADAAAAWRDLELSCPCTVYQSSSFLLPWLATFGRAWNVQPMIIVAFDRDRRPVALLPFGVRRIGPLRIAEFLGGRDSNANIGLFHPDIHWSPADLRSLLKGAVRSAKVRPDVLLLINQPASWEGSPNQLGIFDHQNSASFLHTASLDADPLNFLARHIAGDTAKKLRKKEKRLACLGVVEHRQARTADDVRVILDAFFRQKLERFRRKQIPSTYSENCARPFLEMMALDGLAASTPVLELHALYCGSRIVAVFGGSSYRGHFHAMFNSFELDDEIARTSPGDLLLKSLLERKCRDGLSGFNLGIGEARYKKTWCDNAEPLFDVILPVTLPGRLFMIWESARRHVKRLIKQSDWAWPLVQKLMGRS